MGKAGVAFASGIGAIVGMFIGSSAGGALQRGHRGEGRLVAASLSGVFLGAAIGGALAAPALTAVVSA
jgi:hypothetical protein